jgi:hypothetical protein
VTKRIEALRILVDRVIRHVQYFIQMRKFME